MSVFDTSVSTTATLPTWFSDAQKNIATTGKTVYDTATPFSSTSAATMGKDLFSTPSQQTYGMTPPDQGQMGTAPGLMDPNSPLYANTGVPMDGNRISEPEWSQQPDGTYVPRAGIGGGALPTSSNPFMTAMGTLQGVASGAANPFLSTGAPNTQTALGGLFAAQNAKLNQILPEIAAREGAGGIAGGNMGSLRGQTAVNTARAGALTTLAEQQNKAALEAQAQAIAAAKGVGDVGSQYSTAALNTTDREMNANLNQLAKYSDIVNAMGPTMDKTTNVVTKGSTYENLLKGIQAASAAGATIDKILSGNSGLDWLDKLTKGTNAGLNTAGSGNNLDPSAVDPTTGLQTYGGDLSQAGHWEGGEWVND